MEYTYTFELETPLTYRQLKFRAKTNAMLNSSSPLRQVRWKRTDAGQRGGNWYTVMKCTVPGGLPFDPADELQRIIDERHEEITFTLSTSVQEEKWSDVDEDDTDRQHAYRYIAAAIGKRGYGWIDLPLELRLPPEDEYRQCCRIEELIYKKSSSREHYLHLCAHELEYIIRYAARVYEYIIRWLVVHKYEYRNPANSLPAFELLGQNNKECALKIFDLLVDPADDQNEVNYQAQKLRELDIFFHIIDTPEKIDRYLHNLGTKLQCEASLKELIQVASQQMAHGAWAWDKYLYTVFLDQLIHKCEGQPEKLADGSLNRASIRAYANDAALMRAYVNTRLQTGKQIAIYLNIRDPTLTWAEVYTYTRQFEKELYASALSKPLEGQFDYYNQVRTMPNVAYEYVARRYRRIRVAQDHTKALVF